MDEKWLPIPGVSGYEVSDQGNVRSWKSPHAHLPRLPRPREMKQATNEGGYRFVALQVDGKYVRRLVHRLVMLAFVGPSELSVRHRDDNPANNALVNLLYGTHLENARDGMNNRAHRAHMKARGHA